MGLHLAPTYWALVAGVAVCLRLAPVRGTTAFGAANTLALAVLAGPAVAVAGLTLATGLLALLVLAGGGRSWPFTVLAYAMPVGVFLGYKAAGDWEVVRTAIHCGPLPEAFWLLVALSFSYVFLRSLDATRADSRQGLPAARPARAGRLPVPVPHAARRPGRGVRPAPPDERRSADRTFAERLWPAASDIATGLVYKHVCAEYLRAFRSGSTLRSPRKAWPTRPSCSSTCSSTSPGTRGSALGVGRSWACRRRRTSGPRSPRRT